MTGSPALRWLAGSFPAATGGSEAPGVVCRKEPRVGSNIKVVNCYHNNTTAGGDLIVPDNQEGLYPAS